MLSRYYRTKDEKETNILTTEAESTYTVYTFNLHLKRKLAAFAEKYPESCRLIRDTGDGGVTYEIQKGRLAIRLVPPYDEQRRQQAQESIREHGIQYSNRD